MPVSKINNKLEFRVISTILVPYYILKSTKFFIVNNVIYYLNFKTNYTSLIKLHCVNYPF